MNSELQGSKPKVTLRVLDTKPAASSLTERPGVLVPLWAKFVSFARSGDLTRLGRLLLQW